MITKKSVCLIVVLAFGIGIAVGCYNSKTAVRELHLREVLSIGGIDQDVLSQWADVVVDGQDDLFVTDDMDFSVKKFDAKGNLIKKAGRKGQGPGEFSAPRYVGCSEKLVYVTDQ
jgi:hypothetical protein